MKTRLTVYLSLELLFAVFLGEGICILRRDETMARRAWRDNPTAESKAELDRQRAITRSHNHKLTAVLFTIMAVFTVPIIVSASRRNLAPPAKPA